MVRMQTITMNSDRNNGRGELSMRVRHPPSVGWGPGSDSDATPDPRKGSESLEGRESPRSSPSKDLGLGKLQCLRVGHIGREKTESEWERKYRVLLLLACSG